jgi:tetratricopeptide (TPR) repeat protein
MAHVRWHTMGFLVLSVVCGCSNSPEARRDKFLARARGNLQKKDYSRAILDLKSAAQVAPNDVEVSYQLGLTYLAAGDVPNGVRALLRTISLNPKHAGAQLRLAQLESQSNNPSLLREAQKRLQDLIGNSSSNSDVLDTLALADLQLGENSGDAARILEQAIAQSPDEVNSFVMLAWAKWQQKDSKGAETVLKDACDRLPGSAQARRVLAGFYISQARFAEGESALRGALELDPKSGRAWLDLGRLQIRQGKKQEAEQSFRQLAALQGYRSWYGVFLFKNGRREEAGREFERVLRENPDDRQARLYLLITYRALDRSADIDRLLADALKKNKKDTEALLQRAEILTDRGQCNQAEADLNTASKLNPAMPEVHYLRARIAKQRGLDLSYRNELVETLQINRALLGVRIELAQDYVRAHNGQAALDTLDGALPSQKPTAAWLAAHNWALWTTGNLAEMRTGIDNGLSHQRSLEFLVQDALWKFRSGNPSGAQAVLREALALDPANLGTLEVLNSTYASQNNSPLGLEKVKEYAARVPNSAPVQNLLAQLLSVSGDRAQAKAVLNAAKSRVPQATELDFSLTQIDYAEHNYDGARVRLQALVSRDPQDLKARLWLGAVELKQGDHQAAIQNYRKILEVRPDDAYAGNNLAYELAEHTNSLDEALKYAQQSVERAPDQLTFADTLGWILYRKGLYPSAVSYLERANQDPKDALAKYHLAMAYAKAGDPRTVATLQAALKLDPALPEAKMAQTVVGKFHE